MTFHSGFRAASSFAQGPRPLREVHLDDTLMRKLPREAAGSAPYQVAQVHLQQEKRPGSVSQGNGKLGLGGFELSCPLSGPEP